MSNVPMTLPHLALAVQENEFFHNSTFAERSDGSILHAAKQVFTTSADGGLTWSEPHRKYDTNGDIVGGDNNSLVRLASNGVGLATYGVEDDARKDVYWDMRAPYVKFWRSQDGGETWEPPVRMTEKGAGAFMYQDVLLRTASGRILMPVYLTYGQYTFRTGEAWWGTGKLVNGHWVSTAAHFSDPSFSTVAVYYSDDDGRTWQRNKDGELVILLDTAMVFSHIGEPSVTEVYPGCLLMISRTGLGRLFQAWSYDNGETWTRPMPSSLASSPAPAQIRTLPNGHLLCVWNQESEEETRRGYNRTRLSSAISRNGGSVWEFFQNIESLHETTRVEPGPVRFHFPEERHSEPGRPAFERDPSYVQPSIAHGRWSYPSVLVMKDRVLVAHTYGMYEEHHELAQLNTPARMPDHAGPKFNQKLKVLPLEWFYGGKKPADNPFLKRAHEAAVP